MEETAQPVAAETDPNVQLQNAANAFKAFDAPPPEQARDDQGRFASNQDEEAPLEEAVEDEESDTEYEGAEETAEEVQSLPPSWPQDQAEMWASLPAETQEFILGRDAEQVRAVNAKFEEAAKVRRAVEAEVRTEANAKRDELIGQLEQATHVMQALAGAQPDPRAFVGNEAAYHQALAQWNQNTKILSELEQQRQVAVQEKAKSEEVHFSEWKRGVEAEWAPKLLEVAPELKDPLQGGPYLQSMIDYAKQNGIAEDVFSAENQTSVTSPELMMIWKAMQYDKAMAGRAKAKPKPSPALKPGVVSPRSARKTAHHKQARDRLAREGSVEAGAAVFKNAFSGR